MTEQERRKHPRCNTATAVSYHFFNKKTRHEAVARNYSRFGMYFEEQYALVPGTIIVIRSQPCNADVDPDFTPAFCSQDRGDSEACGELKTLVVAEVKRCEVLKEVPDSLFGIAVHYISPAT